MDDYLRAICAVHGVFLAREALDLGLAERTFTRLVRGHHFHRVRHGAYTFPDIWAGLDEPGRHRLRARAAYRTSRVPVALSHESAILDHTDGWWDLDLSEVNLTKLDGDTGRREAGRRPHAGDLVREDVEMVDGFLRTTATRTALDLASQVGPEQSLVVFDSLLREGKTTKAELLQRYEEGLVRFPGMLGTRLTIQLANGLSGSVGESRGRYLFWTEHLPMPTLQHQVFSPSGVLLGTTDFWWEEYGVIGEFDGMVKYTRLLRPGETATQAVIREKLREEEIQETTGCRFFRMIWADLARRQATRLRLERLLRGPRARTYVDLGSPT